MKKKTIDVFQYLEDKAKHSDKKDPLKSFRKKFLFPQHKGESVLYFTGNSLGLQPINTQKYIQQELNDWAKYGVEGHFKAQRPWFSYHENLTQKMANIVGAQPQEVIMMNQLTSNLHFLMTSFYTPNSKKRKILMEYPAFPSDIYAIQSQIKIHGGDPEKDLIFVSAEKNDFVINEEKIIQSIHLHHKELALVLLGGVNYLSGQVFDIEKITKTAHQYNIICGWDLAHAAGNIELKLHDWEVDFAVWCTYKYLNSGPGSVGGAFIHQKHLKNTDLPIMAGWWGTDKKERFKMKPIFEPMPTAERWQVSNAPVLSMAACLASLDIFEKAEMKNLIKKSQILTGFLEEVLLTINKINHKEIFKILTPAQSRGAQLSIICNLKYPKKFFDALIQAGIYADWREPNVIRMAPVPLYNSFEDIYLAGKKINKLLKKFI